MGAHWTDAYYGELYLRSVRHLLTPRLSAIEAALVARLLRLGPADRVLDLACGHGRHAGPLSGRVGWLLGLERSAEALRLADGAAPAGGARPPSYVRADLRALPLRPGSFDAVYSWYASLFMFDEPGNAAALASAARLLRPGGRLLVHHANPLALAAEPRAVASHALPGGGLVEEASAFDPATGVDRCARRLRLPDGRLLDATAELRYYSPPEWELLAARAGLRLVELTSSAPPPGGGLTTEAPDLIALLESP
ncbi:MAG: class I SAM-dependent methyltransferase [Anaeromyxobacteraceae bacterium]|nr:class I SAM-dependent methyltransferase [Anaeromyxobacteraceae bacterium]